MVKDFMKYLISRAVNELDRNNRVLQNPTKHPRDIYRRKSKTFKKNKRKGL